MRDEWKERKARGETRRGKEKAREEIKDDNEREMNGRRGARGAAKRG